MNLVDFEVKTSLPVKQEEPDTHVGRMVPGYAVPVVNERGIRLAALILFLFGVFAWYKAATTGDIGYMKTFGILFVFDMAIRVGLGDRWSPTIVVGQLLTSRRPPQWVGANQKVWAWTLGFAMATTFCLVTGYTSAPMWVTLALCGLCLTLLGLEGVFGVCVGCKLQSLVARVWPSFTPGGTCNVR